MLRAWEGGERADEEAVCDEQEDAIHDYEISDRFQPGMKERIWGTAAEWVDSRF